jgi:starch phosphorylase
VGTDIPELRSLHLLRDALSKHTTTANLNDENASSMCDKLEPDVLPLFHRSRHRLIDVMRHAIALNGSFFNSHRMVEEYRLKAYAR